MCVVSMLTGSPAGKMGRGKAAALLASALQGSVSGEGCSVEGEEGQTNSLNHDLPQDPGFTPADMVLSWHGCSKASEGYIPPCLSSSVTAFVSFPARASRDLLQQQLQGFIPFPGLQVSRKTRHPRGTKNSGCHLQPQGCQRRQNEKDSGERVAAQWR